MVVRHDHLQPQHLHQQPHLEQHTTTAITLGVGQPVTIRALTLTTVQMADTTPMVISVRTAGDNTSQNGSSP